MSKQQSNVRKTSIANYGKSGGVNACMEGSMINNKTFRLFYVVAGLYDGILGIVFVLFPSAIFNFYEVEPPNHMAYVQFPGLLLIVFAAMFFRVAANPIRNRELIIYGIGLKISYCGTAFWYETTAGIPFMWIPWMWIDLVFLVLFVITWISLDRQAKLSP